MNIGSLIKQELQTLLADAENSPLGETLKTYIAEEVTKLETELKSYIDAELAKAFQPSGASAPAKTSA